jgi:hypothetical protein
MTPNHRIGQELREVKAVKIVMVVEDQLMTMDVLPWTAREACRPEITIPKVRHGVHRNRAILINVVALHQDPVTTDLLAKMAMETQDSMIKVDMELLHRRRR